MQPCTSLVQAILYKKAGSKMGVMSIKDYAKARNISYEAARQQVKRYAEELDGHITKQNRTQYLDDFAVELLDEHRQQNPVVVINQDRDEALEQLRAENKALTQRVMLLQSELIEAQKGAIETAKGAARLEAAEADKDRLAARAAALERELEEARRPWWQKILVKK